MISVMHIILPCTHIVHLCQLCESHWFEIINNFVYTNITATCTCIGADTQSYDEDDGELLACCSVLSLLAVFVTSCSVVMADSPPSPPPSPSSSSS